MPKNQLKLLVGYCVFMLVMTQVLQRISVFHPLLNPLAAIFGALLPIAISVFAIKNGWALGRTRQIDRGENPISYWLLVALGFAIAAYLLIEGVRGLAHAL